MNWIPINKKHGPNVEYPPVTDAEKTAMEADPQTKGKYTFKVAGDTVPKVAAKPKPEKERLVPIGVDIPDEPKEKELPQA